MFEVLGLANDVIVQRRVHSATQVAELPLSSCHPTNSKPTPRFCGLMCFYGLRQALTKLAEFRVSVRLEILQEGSIRKDRGNINDQLGWES
jgi:hypothetical protein